MNQNAILAASTILVLLSIGSLFQPNQTSKVKLLVTVIDAAGKNVEGATITIYSSEEDYQNSINELIVGKSDKKGRFQFKGLESKSYFLDVRKDAMNNAADGAETGLISQEKVNKILVTVK
ncbi:MAG: carboxypeptidase-like regulatory domain-containing protein [Ekhidna sp.]